jgi:hypothetical protein
VQAENAERLGLSDELSNFSAKSSPEPPQALFNDAFPP